MDNLGILFRVFNQERNLSTFSTDVNTVNVSVNSTISIEVPPNGWILVIMHATVHVLSLTLEV